LSGGGDAVAGLSHDISLRGVFPGKLFDLFHSSESHLGHAFVFGVPSGTNCRHMKPQRLHLNVRH
tara:strand:+ start:605 stop:799 length:195 start_codon:yes stop_codon:yes gene_type:complete